MWQESKSYRRVSKGGNGVCEVPLGTGFWNAGRIPVGMSRRIRMTESRKRMGTGHVIRSSAGGRVIWRTFSWLVSEACRILGCGKNAWEHVEAHLEKECYEEVRYLDKWI